METLKTIRLQLSAVEEAYREKRLRDVIDTLVTLHDLVDILASAFLAEQMRQVVDQLNRLAEVGLVVADLELQLELAHNEPSPARAAELIEEVWRGLQTLLMTGSDGSHLLVRTNIFPRGKKSFLPYQPGDTLRDIALVLKRRYAHHIAAHLKSRGASVVIPEAVDIVFFGSQVWEQPDEAVLSEHTRIDELARSETEGILWFPVLPGDSPLPFEEEDDSESFMNLLENFTIEADINHLEAEMLRMAARMKSPEALPGPGSWRSRAYLVRGEGTEHEERIPLIGERISLGRGRENDIQILNDVKVSRFHCRLIREGDAYFVEDNSSSNGTLVDGAMISRRPITGGELVTIGNTVFRFLKD